MLKYLLLAEEIRAQVEDGTLRPGQPAPSRWELVRATGYSDYTCGRALRELVAAGVLVPGPSPQSRHRVRVAAASTEVPSVADAVAALSERLARGRNELGLTQSQLADQMRCSHRSVAHAETQRIWQARRFWARADTAIGTRGDLLALHDAYQRAKTCCLQAPGWWDVLPPRERHVAQLSAQGMDVPGIAREMRIPERTVRHHLDVVRVATGRH